MKETKKSKSIISHTSKGSVLDDLGLNNEACSSIKVKAEIHSKIIKEIEKNKITSRELEKLLDKPQPRVSELLNGKISNISIEKLLDYLNLLGGEATVKVIFKKRKSA
ncbi:MAG: XRE family transcriptional regulator [Halobacteriovoraceae bacterium]|nr:XRE family transcriptional regulator [Halobacteriovoraceae bacterium]